MLEYSVNQPVSVAEFRDVLIRSTLGARRPIGDADCLRGMLQNANLIATCRSDALLVGIARAVTDFTYCCYLSDLAVDQAYQRQGIGRRLMAEIRRKLSPHCTIILLAAPDAVDYYPRLGFRRHPQCWLLESPPTESSSG